MLAVRRASAAYMRALEQRPVVTKSLTAAALSVLGDVIAQKGIEKRTEWQPRRTLAMGLYGLALGPVLHPWYGFVSRTAARVVPASGLKQAAVAITIDQVFIPPPLIAAFWLVAPVIEGRSLDEAQAVLASNFVPTLVANYKVWPAVQLANFALVPPPLRVLFVNVFSLGWNTFISLMGHRQAASGDHA